MQTINHVTDQILERLEIGSLEAIVFFHKLIEGISKGEEVLIGKFRDNFTLKEKENINRMLLEVVDVHGNSGTVHTTYKGSIKLYWILIK